MIKFSSILESDSKNSLVNGQHSQLKKIIIDLIIDDKNLKKSIQQLQSGFLNQSQSKLTVKDLEKVYQESKQFIDLILSTTDWFSKSPQDLGIQSINVYTIESTKKALAETCQLLLNQIS